MGWNSDPEETAAELIGSKVSVFETKVSKLNPTYINDKTDLEHRYENTFFFSNQNQAWLL